MSNDSTIKLNEREYRVSQSWASEAIKKWKSSKTIRAEFGNDLGAYAAYCEAEAAGLVKNYNYTKG